MVVISSTGNIYVTSDLINYSSQNYYSKFNGFGGYAGLRDIKTTDNEFYLFGSNNQSSVLYKYIPLNSLILLNTFSNMTYARNLVIYDPPLPPLPPLPPTSLVVYYNSNNISIYFDQSGTVTNYKYSLNNGPYIEFSPPQTTSPLVLSPPIVQLGVPYEIRLKAVNIGVDSEPS
jgi:hypothetical protein